MPNQKIMDFAKKGESMAPVIPSWIFILVVIVALVVVFIVVIAALLLVRHLKR